LGLLPVANTKPVAHAAVVCEGRRRLEPQTWMKAFLLAKIRSTHACESPSLKLMRMPCQMERPLVKAGGCLVVKRARRS
jgi:hypothetical protein